MLLFKKLKIPCPMFCDIELISRKNETVDFIKSEILDKVPLPDEV